MSEKLKKQAKTMRELNHDYIYGYGDSLTKFVRLAVVLPLLEQKEREIEGLKAQLVCVAEQASPKTIKELEGRLNAIHKHIAKMPMYEDLDDIGGMENIGVQMFGVSLDEWREVLEGLASTDEKEGESLK